MMHFFAVNKFSKSTLQNDMVHNHSFEHFKELCFQKKIQVAMIFQKKKGKRTKKHIRMEIKLAVKSHVSNKKKQD